MLARGPSHAVIEAARGHARARGGELRIEDVERGLFTDVLRGVRLELGGETHVDVPELAVTRRLLADTEIRAPGARVSLRGDPVSAFSTIRALASDAPASVELGRTTVAYRDRAIGDLSLDGVNRAGAEDSFRAERLSLGTASWNGAIFSLGMRNRVLEARFGSDATPRAAARYVPSDGRGAEWRIDLPHQPFAALRRSLGLGDAPAEDRSHITGNLSWVIPDDAALGPRGSLRCVIDGWDRPAWPDAAALTGSSGAIAAVVVPAPDGNGLLLRRVEIVAALFALEGQGTVTASQPPRISIEARGSRTCRALAENLPPSRYRDAARAKASVGEDTESVELRLSIELALGSPGSLRFRWQLGPECGFGELG